MHGLIEKHGEREGQWFGRVGERQFEDGSMDTMVVDVSSAYTDMKKTRRTSSGNHSGLTFFHSVRKFSRFAQSLSLMSKLTAKLFVHYEKIVAEWNGIL